MDKIAQAGANLSLILAKLGEIPVQAKYAADMADCMIGLERTLQLLGEPEPQHEPGQDKEPPEKKGAKE